MKLRAAQKVHYDSGPNMTPLVDIVMVILIFLMLTGTFAVGEHFLQSNVPLTPRGTSGGRVSNVPLDEPLEIRVDSLVLPGEGGVSQEVWEAQAGRFLVRNSRVQLAGRLREMREALNKNDTPTEKIQVVINPGRRTKYRHLVEVYQAALEAEFTKVAFSRAH